MTAFPTGDASPGPGGVVPVCPRHPSRESYVRCQRCERPVCPECQRAAAVGVQCVDCVREQAKTIRAPRTVFGGRVTGVRPAVTQVLIAANVFMYLLQWFGFGPYNVTAELAFLPSEAFAEPYRFITSAFLHSPNLVLHILMNMYALWLLGPYLEQLLGHGRFVALYLLSAFGGSVGYFVLVPPSLVAGSGWFSGAVGASGAIFGLFGALLVVNRRLQRDTGGILAIIIINGIIGFVPAFNIAWQAHLGGMLTGALAAAVLARSPAKARTRRQVVGLSALLVLLIVLTLAKAATVPPGLLS